MPTLAALTINAAKLNAQEIYEESISDPTDTSPTTLEMLNGRLDANNFATSAPAWACQPGAFIRAVHLPFDRWEFVYARQLSQGEESDNAVVVGALSARVFIPWDCTSVVVGWQAMWRHDATLSYADGAATYVEENWNVKFFVAGTQIPTTNLTLSPSRAIDGISGGHEFNNVGVADEDRWVWSSHHVAFNNSTNPEVCAKQYLSVLCKVTTKIRAQSGVADPKVAKLLIPSGALTVIAVR